MENQHIEIADDVLSSPIASELSKDARKKLEIIQSLVEPCAAEGTA